MRAVIVFVIVAIKATAAVRSVEVYSEKVDFDISNSVREPERSAELINYSNVQMEFRHYKAKRIHTLYMKAILPQDQGGSRPTPPNDNPCGQWIGVKMDEGQKHFCRITRFGMELDYLPRNRVRIQFTVFFQSNRMPNVLLEIPVLEQPPSVRSESLSTWAEQRHVGILSPLTEHQISTLRSSEGVTLEFAWLSDILKLKVGEAKMKRWMLDDDDVDEIYRTRPLVLPKRIIEKIQDEVEWFINIKYRSRSSGTHEFDRVHIDARQKYSNRLIKD